MGVQPVKAATARNDRGESQPRVVWGIRRGLVPASVLWCVERSGVAVGTVIALGSGPMFSGLIDLALHRRHPAMKWYTGTAVMLVGVAVLVAGGANDSSEISLSLFGMLSAMAAGLGYAVYAHTTSVLISARSGVNRGSRFQFALAALILSPFLIASVVSSSDVGWVWSTSGIVMLLHLGVLTAGIAYVLYGWGLRTLHASTAVSITWLSRSPPHSLRLSYLVNVCRHRDGWQGY